MTISPAQQAHERQETIGWLQGACEGSSEDAFVMLPVWMGNIALDHLMGQIGWAEIYDVPDELMDGRPVLLWVDDSLGKPGTSGYAVIGAWATKQQTGWPDGWTCGQIRVDPADVSHFAQITLPRADLLNGGGTDD